MEIENGRLLVKYAADNNLEGMRALLSNGASVNAKEYKLSLFYKSKNYMTPLQRACQQGHVECAKLLLEHGGGCWLFLS